MSIKQDISLYLNVAALMLLTVVLSACDAVPDDPVEPDAVGGPRLVRLLTESQYRATIADIFGPRVPVVARFGRALRSDGLIAVGSSEAGMTAFSIEQFDSAALGVANYVLSEEQRHKYLRCAPDSAADFDTDCAQRFITDYGEKLFRRPLSDEQIARLVNTAETAGAQLNSFYEGLKYALVGMMTSPEFLFRIERGKNPEADNGLHQLDAYSRASRLSYFLTNSTPDDELLRAALSGELDTEKGLATQVDRLISSPGFEVAVRAFFRDMLEFDLFEDLSKDSEIYPAFNSTVAEDAQEQTLRTISDHLIAQRGDYRDLFTLRDTFLTRSLGIIYRLPVATRNGWEKAIFPEDAMRTGIQSHVSFLALHSHPGRSSPTLRGMAIREVFLCQEVPDPPADVDFSVIQDPSSTHMPTARDRLSAHNTQAACAGCHKIMDPPGLALENFDGVGSYRTVENKTPIDISGELDGTSFDDVGAFAHALRNHPEAPRCLVEKMYRFAVGRDTVWDEREYMDYLIDRFANDGYQLPKLMRTIALSKNFFAVWAPTATPAHRKSIRSIGYE